MIDIIDNHFQLVDGIDLKLVSSYEISMLPSYVELFPVQGVSPM